MKEKKSFFQKITSGFPERETSRNIRVSDEDYGYDEIPTASWDGEDEELDGELSVDMYQTDKDLVIEAMIAGVKP